MPPDTTCSPTSKDTTIVSGSIPPSGISPPNRQSAKPLNPVSTKSQEGQPYVKRGKNDATDAEAICEAVSRPNMRFVPVKSADQQAVLMLHRTRALLIRQQTMLANAFRAHLAEFGIVLAQGIRHVR